MSKKFILRRETWGKRKVIVARKEGKFFSWKKIDAKKGMNEQSLKNIFRRNKSFDKSIKKVLLTKVVETTDFREKTHNPRRGNYQAIAQVRLKTGEIVQARSRQHPSGFPFKKAQEEAEESLFERVSQIFGLAYDAEEGKRAAQENKLQVKQGVVFYRKK